MEEAGSAGDVGTDICATGELAVDDFCALT